MKGEWWISIQRGVTFVTTFHPRMHNVIQSHNTNFIHLQASAHMRQLFPHKPLIAMRRTANIGNLVIHTKPRDAPIVQVLWGVSCSMQARRCLPVVSKPGDAPDYEYLG